MDARAEIEAKRARLAELRRQRQRGTTSQALYDESQTDSVVSTVKEEPEIAPTPPNDQAKSREWTTACARLFQSDGPIYYSKRVQTTKKEEIHPEQAPVVESESRYTAPSDPASRDTASTDPTSTDPADSASTSDAVVEDSSYGKEKKDVPLFRFASENSPVPSALFLDNAWRVVARVSQNNLSVLKSSLEAPAEKTDIKYAFSLEGPEKMLDRSVVAMDASHELAAVAYRATSDSGPMGQGLIYIYSLDAPEQPEYTLCTNSDILSVKFATTNSHFVYGSGYNGRIFVWDLRTGRFNLAPTLKSNNSYHSFPITSLQISGSNLLSGSSDGTLCTWSSDFVAKPKDHLELAAQGSLRTLTALAIYPNDSTQFAVGTLEGTIFRGHCVDSISARAGIDGVIGNHAAAISCLAFRKNTRTIETGNYLLSGGLDWSIRLWYVPLEPAGGPSEPLLEFMMNDTVCDVAWCPNHASVFASAVQSTVQVWDLNKSTDIPVATFTASDLASRISWVGSRLLVGTAAGEVEVIDVSESLLKCSELDWHRFKELFA